MSPDEEMKRLLSEIESGINEHYRRGLPDPNKIVYCDRHLSTQMRPQMAWGMAEYGKSSVDVNREFLWACPKTDCDRHYSPTTFGYHSRKPGALPSIDGAKQPTSDHPGDVYMYIGKVGEGRAYRCPLYLCEEIGPEVAAFVADEDIPASQDPLAGMKIDDRKRMAEMEIFRSFAIESGLEIEPTSPVGCNPPEPDISCMISGQQHWFELGEIVEEDVAEKLRPGQRTVARPFSYDQEHALINIVRKKAQKTYATNGAPIDLVLYFGLRFASGMTARRLCEQHVELLDTLTSTGPFSRVWVFDAFKKTVVWK